MHSIRKKSQKIIKTLIFAVETGLNVRKSAKRGLTLLFAILKCRIMVFVAILKTT